MGPPPLQSVDSTERCRLPGQGVQVTVREGLRRYGAASRSLSGAGEVSGLPTGTDPQLRPVAWAETEPPCR